MSRAKVTFISVDGHGGSGKSSLADQLSRVFQAEVVHIDDFTGQGAPSDWYKKVIELVIDPAISGTSSLSYPRSKWWPEHRPEPVVDQLVTPTLIIEGVCSSRRELRDYMTLKVFVDTPRDICIERGLARDRGMGGKSDEEIVAIWNQWIKWDDEYFAKDNPKSIADVVVDGTKIYDNAIEAIVTALNELKE